MHGCACLLHLPFKLQQSVYSCFDSLPCVQCLYDCSYCIKNCVYHVAAYFCVFYLFSNFSLVLLMILSLCPAFRAHMSVTIELRTVFVILSSTNEGMNALAQSNLYRTVFVILSSTNEGMNALTQSNLYQTICAATALFQPLVLFSHMKMGKMWLKTGRVYIVSFDVIVDGHPCWLGPLDGAVNLLKIGINFYCGTYIYHGDTPT